MTLEVDDKIPFRDPKGVTRTGYVTQLSSDGSQVVVEQKHCETLHILTWSEEHGIWAAG